MGCFFVYNRSEGDAFWIIFRIWIEKENIMRFHRIIPFFLILMLPVLLTGCAAAVRPSGYLKSYENFNYVNKPDLKIRCIAPPGEVAQPDVIVVRDAQLRGILVPSIMLRTTPRR